MKINTKLTIKQQIECMNLYNKKDWTHQQIGDKLGFKKIEIREFINDYNNEIIKNYNKLEVPHEMTELEQVAYNRTLMNNMSEYDLILTVGDVTVKKNKIYDSNKNLIEL